MYTYLVYFFIYLPDLVIIYSAKFDCKVHNLPRLTLLYAGGVSLYFVKFKLLKKDDDNDGDDE